MNVLDLLRKQLPQASMTTLRQMIRDRRVQIDGCPALTLKEEVPAGAKLQIAPNLTTSKNQKLGDQPPGETPDLWRESRSRRSSGRRQSRGLGENEPLPFTVVHQDRDLIVINKPTGLLTSSSPRERRPTALGLLRDSLQLRGGRVGLVHRLDKDASGLCVFSLHTEAFLALKRQFADKSARRTYRAIVDGPMDADSGTIDNLLVELVDGTVRPTRDPKRGKRAVTHWKRLASRGHLTLLELQLETGRKHQLRTQLADLGNPIVGDVLYHQRPLEHFPMVGIPRNSPAARPRLLLAAISLGFVHPRSGNPVDFSIPTPEAFGDWSNL